MAERGSGDGIVFRGPHCRPGDEARATSATAELRRAAIPIIERFGGPALIDALISVWLDLNLTGFGVSNTDEMLRQLRRDLPKFAAAHRAMNATPQGTLDG
jgi:hypothetical protein